jgi:hypothetical protein
MKKEYDFSKAVKAKFYVKPGDIETPVYLDKNVRRFFDNVAASRNTSVDKVVNAVLRKEMAIHKTISSK